MSNDTQNIKRKELFGHPMGLYVLFFTEMWERFSYYGMRAILVLYITASVTAENAGLGWAEGDALALYGWYTMLVYVMSIPGGIIADKLIGQKKSVLYGGLILVAGHGILAVEQMWAFYLGLLLIVLGVGGLKPNISTMVGGLYKEGDIRRDKGFTIFYIGINIGAAAAALAVGYVGEEIGWHWGFGMAGVGMLLGQLVFMLGQKHLIGVGEAPVKSADGKNEDSLGRLFSKLMKPGVPMFVTGLLIALGIGLTATGTVGYGLLTIFLAFVVGMMMVIYTELTQIEKDRYVVLLLSFILVIVFWGAFEQAGGLMNIYTKEKVNRMVLGWEIPASVFQSVNAIFIIIFGAIVANFWAFRKKKGKESSSLFKMAIGTIIMGLGFLFMAKASLEVLATGEAALVWIILAYLLHTLGELSLSPVALSFITKLAPAKYVSIMMGVYFAATGLGNKVAGAIGEASQSEPIHINLVAENAQISGWVEDSVITKALNMNFDGEAYLDNGQIVLLHEGENVTDLFNIEKDTMAPRLAEVLTEYEATAASPQVVNFKLENETDQKALKALEDADSPTDQYSVKVSNYSGDIAVFQAVNERELRTFISITIFTIAFSILLILFLKKLKKLTHGVEEAEREMSEEEAEVDAH
ncbi:peptide MFS transporter [Phaeocystidibacter luteus]|uniref:MFS transporter n=1 Tax=Phaeocystidibacter luteus TaxID=911197 RepID=A0A6N6RFK3_9FLAO|nr:peptide MFS transporter [Phaeocystidibacter luteus]KAB2805472.1 MFS transporter [Phaeocystidibacter luteus]